MTQRHPNDAMTSNPNDTAPPRQRAAQQSFRHGATQTTPWSTLPTAQRHTHATRSPAIPTALRHPRDTPGANPHGTELTTLPSGHHDDTATTRRHRADIATSRANPGPAPRPPDYKREPFATRSGKCCSKRNWPEPDLHIYFSIL